VAINSDYGQTVVTLVPMTPFRAATVRESVGTPYDENNCIRFVILSSSSTRGVVLASSNMQKPCLIADAFRATNLSQTRAIEVSQFAKVDNNTPAQRDEGLDRRGNFARVPGDQPAVTLDRGHFISVFIF